MKSLIKKNIHYVSAACGAGKTHVICDYISSNMDKKHLIVLPTIALGKDYLTALQGRHVPFVNCINSSDNESVAKLIEQSVIKINSMDDGGVIIITQSALSTAKFLQHVNTWHLIVDEILSVDRLLPFPTPHTLSILTDSVSVDEAFVHESLYKLTHNNAVLTTQYDKNLAPVKHLVADMDTFYEAFVEKNNWNTMVVDKTITPDSKSNRTYGNQNNTLSILVMLTPKITEQFGTVTILGANFENSMLYKWWSENFSVEFTPNTNLLKQLRYTTHNNGDRLTICYLSEVDFSKTQRNKPINETIDGVKCESNGGKLAAQAIHTMESNFIFITNNDFGGDAALIDAGGQKVSVISHGSNNYASHHQLYFGAALNKNPAHNRMLKGLGFTDNFQFTATTIEITYQGLMRTSLRDMDCKEPVLFVCNDCRSATGVAEFFPNCHVIAADDCTKKDIPLTQAQRNKRSKAKKLLNIDSNGYSAMDFVGCLRSLSTHNIVVNNEPPQVMPKLALIDDFSYFSINFTGDINDFNALAKNHNISSVTYSVKDVIGYTANVFIKKTGTAYDANVAFIPLMTTNGLSVYGFDSFAPSCGIDDDSCFYKINCDRTSKLESNATRI